MTEDIFLGPLSAPGSGWRTKTLWVLCLALAAFQAASEEALEGAYAKFTASKMRDGGFE